MLNCRSGTIWYKKWLSDSIIYIRFISTAFTMQICLLYTQLVLNLEHLCVYIYTHIYYYMDEMFGVFTAINICRVSATFTRLWKNMQTGSDFGVLFTLQMRSADYSRLNYAKYFIENLKNEHHNDPRNMCNCNSYILNINMRVLDLLRSYYAIQSW